MKPVAPNRMTRSALTAAAHSRRDVRGYGVMAVTLRAATTARRSIRADRQFGCWWEGCRLGERDRVFDFGSKLSVERGHLVWCPHAVGDQLLCRALDRTPGGPRLHLLAGAIALVVVPERADVLTPSIRHALQQGWSVSSPRPRDRLTSRLVNGKDIIAVDTFRRDAV